MTERKNQKYIVTELKMPESKQRITTVYSKYATRILWLDDAVVEGAFHMNCSWFFKASETVENVAHTHDSDEIIGFFGSNPQSPYDLCGEIEIWLEDENYILTRSCLIFIPAGMKHCPLTLKKVDRPIFHFTTVTSGEYKKSSDFTKKGC